MDCPEGSGHLSGVELFAQGGDGAGSARGGERVEPDGQGAVAGDDVAACGEGFADQGVGFVAGAGVWTALSLIETRFSQILLSGRVYVIYGNPAAP